MYQEKVLSFHSFKSSKNLTENLRSSEKLNIIIEILTKKIVLKSCQASYLGVSAIKFVPKIQKRLPEI